MQPAHLAAGRMDAFWQFGADLCNWLGRALLARDAGATVTDARGRPFDRFARSVAIAAPGIHGEFPGRLAAAV